MCGLIGSWHPDGQHPPTLAAGLAAIAHRGPDSEGWHDFGRVRFGHRRLSIVDVAGGKQPLFSEDQYLCLVYNGEIYNHRSILAGLRQQHQPRTRSDGEAWLHAAEEHGPLAAVAQLHGMFALAGSDGGASALVATRWVSSRCIGVDTTADSSLPVRSRRCCRWFHLRPLKCSHRVTSIPAAPVSRPSGRCREDGPSMIHPAPLLPGLMHS